MAILMPFYALVAVKSGKITVEISDPLRKRGMILLNVRAIVGKSQTSHAIEFPLSGLRLGRTFLVVDLLIQVSCGAVLSGILISLAEPLC